MAAPRTAGADAARNKLEAAVVADARPHEDLALFQRVQQYLAELEAEVQLRSQERGPHVRRLARLRTCLEDARLQAVQGLHEARHGQTETDRER